MDDLLSEFLTETSEHLQGIETQLVQFERNPTDASLVSSIFRLVHTIKGTSSFLGLDRLQSVAHSAETLIGDLRDGVAPTRRTVSLILAAIDRIKSIVSDIELLGAEAEGSDADLIAELKANVAGKRTDQEAQTAPEHPAPAARQTGQATAPAAQAKRRPAAKAKRTAAPVKPSGGKSVRPPTFPERAARAQPAPGQGAARASDTIRVTVDTIERIMLLVSELVLNRNQLLEITRNRDNDPIKPPLQRLSALTTDLQDAVMRARMQPVERLFSGLPRLMRELCAELHKKIDLVTEGADTELDRQLIEVLRDPLTHLIRNCADHGIEKPEERLAAGKPEFGEIRVSASHQAGQINIDVSDDGRGLDLNRIRQKVIANGLASKEQVAHMATEELCRFIFAPGFSTATKVTSVSGRGVGMDVVRSNIEAIGGSVSLFTVAGRGSRFSLKIPLTLAIAPALIVRVGDQRFALPQQAVVEAVGLGRDSRHAIEKVQDALVLRLRDEVVPVIDLGSILGLQTPADQNLEERLVVIVRIGTASFGVRVDAVLDVQEIVVKPLNASLAHLKIFAGQTILGDGSVVLILDPGSIGTQLGIEKSNEKKRESKTAHETSDLTRLVLFRAGDGLPKVLPLSLLSRIEMVAADRIQKSDGRYLMLHQGRLMPLLPTSPVDELADKPHPVLVITANNLTIGLLVEEIIDIVEDRLDVQLPSFNDNTVGSVQINGSAAELIDVTYYLQAAYASVCQYEPKTILLADDDQFFRDTLKPILESVGYIVTTVGSPEKMQEILSRGNEFDAIMLDARMESSSGRNLARHLRETWVKSDVPIFRLYEMPSIAVLGLPDEEPMTRNLSKLDRQTLLGTLASIFTPRDGDHSAKELAA